jgi:hypothetical protein
VPRLTTARMALCLIGLAALLFAVQKPAEPQRAGPTVVVIDAATGLPCPGATVWAITEDHPSRRVERDPFISDFDHLESLGTAYRADAAGEVTLPGIPRVAELAARAGNNVGVQGVRIPMDTRIAISVFPDPVLTVHVVTATGQPASVAATVSNSYGAGKWGGAASVRTSAAGTLAVRPARWRAPQNDNRLLYHRVDDERFLRVTLDVVTPTAIEATIDERDLPAELTLTLPPCGELIANVAEVRNNLLAGERVFVTASVHDRRERANQASRTNRADRAVYHTASERQGRANRARSSRRGIRNTHCQSLAVRKGPSKWQSAG